MSEQLGLLVLLGWALLERYRRKNAKKAYELARVEYRKLFERMVAAHTPRGEITVLQ